MEGQEKYREEIRGFAGSVDVVATDVFGVGGAPCSGVVATSWVFDFDDFRSAGGFSQAFVSLQLPWAVFRKTSREAYSVLDLTCLPEVSENLCAIRLAIVNTGMW